MSLRQRAFRRVFGLLSLLIIAVCVTAAVFSLREHREIVKNSFRGQSLFLADQVERLVLWDDRVSLEYLLSRLVDEQSVVAYAFVEKTGVPYVFTFKSGVPRGLLNLHLPRAGVSLKTWQSQSGVFYDIAAPLEHDEAVLHVGLARDEIYIESLPKVRAIAALGAVALLIGLGLSWMIAVVATREVDAMTAALRLSEERIRLLLSSAAEGVFGVDLAGTCTFINPAAQGMLGFDDSGQVVGNKLHDLVHHTSPDGRRCDARDCPLHISAHRGEALHLAEDMLWRADGTSFPVEIWSHPIEKDGVPVGAAVTFIDISERKAAEAEGERLQQQLFDARKMEALGQLAGGIAHDFNNLLSPIILIVEVLQDDLDPDSDEARHLDDVLKAARRARQLVHQVLSFSRPQQGERLPVDLNDIVSDVVGLLRSSLPAGVVLEQSADPEPATIYGDSAEIHQVVLNLATNALQAMDERGGRIDIRLQHKTVAKPITLPRATVGRGDYAVLQVQDSGRGMNEDTRDRIFEPFFTTKKGSDGAGLGLAIVDRIVADHGGTIDVDSGDSSGTIFTIYFPTAESRSDTAPPEDGAAA